MTDISELIHTIHTPEELISTSNFAHNFEGLIILLLAITFLFDKKDFVRKKLRPAILSGVGIFLIGFVFLHHTLKEWSIIVRILLEDRQQLQHFLIAIIAIVGGVVEYFGQKSVKRQNILTLSIPAVITLIGIVFLMHPQHGIEEGVTKAVFFHEILGTIFVSSGFLLLAHKAYKEKWLLALSIVLLLVVALLLLTYQEPIGAYHYVQNIT